MISERVVLLRNQYKAIYGMPPSVLRVKTQMLGELESCSEFSFTLPDGSVQLTGEWAGMTFHGRWGDMLVIIDNDVPAAVGFMEKWLWL